eukprot:CAMPEP_0119545750 /NCGR_PEP_ID=MMETSP1352-20130426/414_1 /TAXON_ID=265584 /ORGANISM="Stauroneis constricta, Strain CCMP1120" /LENGTH=76 /DNA_ID=CAMNT_0007590345 /DNA_START=84 /DNA_END=314 /DNA_ORIENTATION=-
MNFTLFLIVLFAVVAVALSAEEGNIRVRTLKKTKSPSDTKAPKETKSPSDTKAPKETKSPTDTKAPKATKAPDIFD